MDPASAAPAAGPAGIPAAPRTPASSPPSVGRSRIAALPRAGSAPLHIPLVAPAHTVPRLSSLRLQPSRLKVISCWSFTPARPVYPAASLRDFLSGAYNLNNGGAIDRHERTRST